MEVKDVELSLGIASFFVDHPGVMTAIQCVGVLFIGYLAVSSLRDAWRCFRGNGTETLHPAQAKGRGEGPKPKSSRERRALKKGK